MSETTTKPLCRCGHDFHNWGQECGTFGCGCRESVQPFDRARDPDGSGFVFAGNVSVGFNLYSCTECGAAVEDSARLRHRVWHEREEAS